MKKSDKAIINAFEDGARFKQSGKYFQSEINAFVNKNRNENNYYTRAFISGLTGDAKGAILDTIERQKKKCLTREHEKEDYFGLW